MKKYIFLFLSFVTFFILFGVFNKTFAASLYFSPDSGDFIVGDSFEISVFVDTEGEYVNAIDITLKFDPKIIQIVNPAGSRSSIEVWVSPPIYSNIDGTIRFIGGIPSPGINNSKGLISTITFRAIQPGKTSITFSDSSKVLRNDPNGTDILSSYREGTYQFIVPPPKGPEVFSLTHPDQEKWYKNNNPTFSWKREKGVTDFSYVLDQDPLSIPDNISEGNNTGVSYSEIEDGIWYFHIKAKRNGVWGEATHYIIRIDTTPPAAFTPVIEPSNKTVQKEPLIYFFTTDALSGLDYYQIKYIEITKDKEQKQQGMFTEVSSPYRLPSLGVGRYLILVKAYDTAGNWREETTELEIIKEITTSKKKTGFWESVLFFVPFIVVFLFVLISFIWYQYRKRQKIEQHKEYFDTKEKEENKKMDFLP